MQYASPPPVYISPVQTDTCWGFKSSRHIYTTKFTAHHWLLW